MYSSKQILSIFFLIGLVQVLALKGFAQLDPTLEANSEKWNVRSNSKIFGGISKPAFGPYNTLQAEKLDSAITRVVTREGTELEILLGTAESDVDLSNKVTIKKTKYFRLILLNTADTTESIFKVHSTTKEKKQGLLGKLFSKVDEGKTEILGYMLDVNGVILTDGATLQWNYFLGNYATHKYGGIKMAFNDASLAKPINGYLKNGTDSFYLLPAAESPGSNFLSILNQSGEYLATVQFLAADGRSSFLWVKKDMDPNHMKAISTFMAIILAIREV